MAYNKPAVVIELNKDTRITTREAKMIHRLLAGWRSTRTPRLGHLQRASIESMKVECLECGRKFKTTSMVPSCPKCKSSDIELA